MAVVPRKAATCILIRERDELEILMAKRNDSLRFMAGHHVFPGGRVDDAEGCRYVEGVDDTALATSIHAAAREAFEETGILPVVGEIPPVAERRKAQADLLDETVTFDEILERFSLHIDGTRFEFGGHWITPEPAPIRFDTRYFIYHMDDDQIEHCIDGEIVALDWLNPTKARRLWQLGKIDLSPPVAFTLRQLSASSHSARLDLLKHGPVDVKGDHSLVEFRSGVYIAALKTATLPPATHTNCILVGHDEMYVIDPGADEEAELQRLRKHIDQLIELGASVKAVLLTHSHRDHTGGVQFVREAYGAPVWAHERTAAQVDFPIDRHIQHDEILESAGDPGWRLKALHTPGHDPGHLCFIEESTRTLICGDMVANPGTIVVSQASGGDMSQFIESLESLLPLESDMLVPAHGRALFEPNKTLQEHIDHRLWRENKIKEAYEAGNDTMDSLLAAAYDDAPKQALPLARHALKSHLTKLGLTVPE